MEISPSPVRIEKVTLPQTEEMGNQVCRGKTLLLLKRIRNHQV